MSMGWRCIGRRFLNAYRNGNTIKCDMKKIVTRIHDLKTLSYALVFWATVQPNAKNVGCKNCSLICCSKQPLGKD